MQSTIIESGKTSILYWDAIPEGRIILEENAKLTIVVFCTVGWQTQKSLQFEFAGPNSELEFLCFIIGTDNNAFAFETVSKHIAPQTKAHFYLKAALFDHSSVDYHGNIFVPQSGHMADTYLAHHTLLLSKLARARTIPGLEIEADEVKAGHAATLGKVDDDMMFYLESRGISRKKAEELLILGFFEEQIQKIHDKVLQDQLRQKILEKLTSKLDIDQTVLIS